MSKHEKKHTVACDCAEGACTCAKGDVATCNCAGKHVGRGRVCRDERFWFGFMTALALAGAVFYAVSVRGGIATGGGAPQDLASLSGREQVVAVAKGMGVNVAAFEKCLADGAHKEAIQKGMGEAAAAGASGTPFSVLIKGDKKVAIKGAYPQAQIEKMMDGFDALPSEDITLPEVTDADHVRGAKDAAFTIVEYSDIDCPYCRKFHKTMTDLVAKRTDVRWVYRHLPLDQLHPDAPLKAEASECVAQLGATTGSWLRRTQVSGNDAFWQFLDTVSAIRQQ